MAKIIIKIEKDDIKTTRIGLNIMVQGNGVDLIFTPEALEELIEDYKNIKEDKKE